MSQRVAVVGAGQMGHGFAVHFVRHGKDVTLIDHRQSNLDRAREQIREVVSFLREREMTDHDPAEVTDDVEFTLDRAAGVADADVVLETISEDLDAKRDVFAGLVEEAPADALLASNTSGLPITDIAAGLEEPGRVVGCHWWFPPYLLEPVEVIRGEETADEYYDRLVSFVESVDRKPVRVQRDVPGFVWNRIQYAIVRECLHLAEEGVASVEDINVAIRDGYAVRTSVIGPLETLDYVGLDLIRTIGENLYPELADDDEPQDIFGERIAEGKAGIEDGAGLLEYDDPPDTLLRRRDEKVAAVRNALEGVEETDS